MHTELTIKNFRCFPDHRPARFTLGPGFTAFVGPNNSGKSSLLRLFYELRSLFQTMLSGDFIISARGGQVPFQYAPSIKDLSEVFCDTNDRGMEIEFRFPMSRPTEATIPLPSHVAVTIPRPTNQFFTTFFGPNGEIPRSSSASIQGGAIVFLANQKLEVSSLTEAAKKLADTLYIGPFRNIINTGTNDNYFDIQVGQAFVQSWRNYKTGDRKRDNRSALQVTSDIERIFGFNRLEINATPGDTTLQILVDGKPYKLNEIGAGIAQFVIVLVNAAIRRPSFILIDEPELNLHPSLQLDFLTTLASYASEGIVFSTHNYGLARAAGDRVYGVRRIAQGESEVYAIESMPRLSEFLGEMSFSGYRELGFEKILLVEGPSDVRTIQQFLRMMDKDHKVVLLQMGGSSLINGISELELQEIKRISANVSALIDSERAAAGDALSRDRQQFRERCRAADIPCKVLEKRAIENYLSDAAVKAVNGPKYRALSPFERLKGVSPAWNKADNWKIARLMTLVDLDPDLRTFLKGL
jgi:energy-coupling factor transporter ATP-binding protein EcfA2